MPDLLFHFASGYFPARVKKKKLFAVSFIIGNVLPDIISRIPDPCSGSRIPGRLVWPARQAGRRHLRAARLERRLGLRLRLRLGLRLRLRLGRRRLRLRLRLRQRRPPRRRLPRTRVPPCRASAVGLVCMPQAQLESQRTWEYPSRVEG